MMMAVNEGGHRNVSDAGGISADADQHVYF